VKSGEGDYRLQQGRICGKGKFCVRSGRQGMMQSESDDDDDDDDELV